MKSHVLHGQLSMFDEPVPQTGEIGGCGRCICNDCMEGLRARCPYGGCYDDRRARVLPYDAAHGGKIRKLWSDWHKPGEQAHWCRGGVFYPTYACEHYVKYIKPSVKYCLAAAVQVWPDGYVQCSLVDAIGCEECMRRWEEQQIRMEFDT